MRDSNELQGKIESFTQVYQDLTGEQLDKAQIKTFLESELTSKKNKLISDAFSGLKIGELKALITVLEPKPLAKLTKEQADDVLDGIKSISQERINEHFDNLKETVTKSKKKKGKE